MLHNPKKHEVVEPKREIAIKRTKQHLLLSNSKLFIKILVKSDRNKQESMGLPFSGGLVRPAAIAIHARFAGHTTFLFHHFIFFFFFFSVPPLLPFSSLFFFLCFIPTHNSSASPSLSTLLSQWCLLYFIGVIVNIIKKRRSKMIHSKIWRILLK